MKDADVPKASRPGVRLSLGGWLYRGYGQVMANRSALLLIEKVITDF